MKILRKEINYLIQLTEAILQFRLQRKKSLLQHLNNLQEEIKKSYRFGTFDESILEPMVHRESYGIRQKIQSHGLGQFTQPTNSITLTLVFQVTEKSQCTIKNEERWVFNLKWTPAECVPTKMESSWAILDLVQHTIRHIIYYELIPGKERQRKNKYMIDYRLEIGSPHPDTKPYKNLWNKSIYSLGTSPHEVFHLECLCYYNEHHIFQLSKQSNASVIGLTKQHKNSDSSTTGTGRKVSLYQFWDEELQTLVLSGSKNCGKEKVEQVCLHVHDSEDDFQILIEENKSLYDTFIEENKKLFDQMSELEEEYESPV